MYKQLNNFSFQLKNYYFILEYMKYCERNFRRRLTTGAKRQYITEDMDIPKSINPKRLIFMLY